MFYHKQLNEIIKLLQKIWSAVRPRLSATLTFEGEIMPLTLVVGKTAQAVWQEWSEPNGAGNKLPTAGPVSYSSSDISIATVDPASGLVTAVAPGEATISGLDAANALTAKDALTVTPEVAQSATLTLTAL